MAIVPTAPATRTIPANLDAEQAVLGSCLSDRDAILAIAPWLTPDDFYHSQHQWIFEAMLACYHQRIPADVITVGEQLRQTDRLDEIGGTPGLMQLANVVPTAMHVEYYGRIVQQTAVARAVIAAGGRIAARGYDALEADELVAQAKDLLDRATKRTQVQSLHTAASVSREFQTWLESEAIETVATGLIDLDRHLVGGFERGDLVIVAARPSIGKTSLALQMVRNLVGRGEIGLFISLEMRRQKLWQRLVALESGIPLTRIRDKHNLGDGELVRIAEADYTLSRLPLMIDDEPDKSLHGIRSRAHALQAEHGRLGLVVIDYLQLMTSGGTRRDGNRALELGEISRGVKKLALELDCPILALSQLNRAVESRVEKVPQLSDLRESGSLEQDPDTVLFIHRPDIYGGSTGAGTAELIIAKQRQGALGKITVHFQPATGKWGCITQRTHDHG